MRLAVIAALAAVGLSSLCAAQSQSCLKPQPVLAGDTPFANGVAFSAQLARSTVGFGEAYIHKAGWFAFTPEVTGQYIIGVCGASVDTKLAIAEACPVHPDLAWDTLAYNDDACAFAGGPGLWASRLFPGNPGRPFNFELSAGFTYLICVGGYAAATAPAAGTLSIDLLPPPVDTCAVATVGTLGANAVPMYETAPDLSLECGGVLYDIGNASYLRFTVPTGGSYIVDTCDQTTDTVLAVLRSCGDGATSFACNDDDCGSASRVSFAAEAGETVWIAAGLYNTAALPPATLTVRIAPAQPPLDPCTSIGTIGIGSNTVPLNSALPDLVVSGGGGAVLHKVNYLRFAAPQAGTYRIDTCPAQGFDSLIACLGTCNDGASVIEVDDDGCGVTGGPSRLTFAATSGQSVLFGVGAWSAVEPLPATAVVRVTFVAPPANPADLDGNGRVDGVDLALLLGNWLGGGVGDVDRSGVVDAADLARLLNAWSS
jgi:hypothetical protein